jgi:uncharacterized membrane protein
MHVSRYSFVIKIYTHYGEFTEYRIKYFLQLVGKDLINRNDQSPERFIIKSIQSNYMGILAALSERVAYHKQRSQRIEALTDGVFAIVMTLLVLDIRVPLKEMNSENDVWYSVLQVVPRILTFILSFSVAGQSWSIFTNHFNYIHRTDRNENIITLLYLMFVSLLPFSTSFLSENPWSRVAMGFYLFNILLMFSFSTLHWFYAYHMGLVKDEDYCVVIHKAIMRRVRAKYLAYGIVVGCCFFNSYLALGGTILIHVVFTFSGFIELLYIVLVKKFKTPGHPLLITFPESTVETAMGSDDRHDRPDVQLIK